MNDHERPRGERAPDVDHASVRSVAPPFPEPTTHDGRNIDRRAATLEGEAASIESTVPSGARSLGEATLAHITPEPGASTTYYEQPILKEPVWKSYVPTYFFTGGVAGATAVIGAAAQASGMRSLVMPARVISMGALAVSAGLLIADLGRPARFINMLRVFRPTSPMNVGTWILSASGAATAGAVLAPFVFGRRAGDAFGLAAGVSGLGLATYTAVLVANTAVPAWQHGARTLPPLFAASAAASGAGALDLLLGGGPASGVLDVFGIGGRVAELTASFAWERSLARAGESVARHTKAGRAKKLLTAAKVLTASSLALSLVARRSPLARRVSGALSLAGALALRFGIMDAGRASARDPRATFEPQRADNAVAAAR
jgi:formate-dependent nitrite reductase membrane component NrfD